MHTSKTVRDTLFRSCFSSFNTRQWDSLLLTVIWKETVFIFPLSNSGIRAVAREVAGGGCGLKFADKGHGHWVRSFKSQPYGYLINLL